MIHQIPKSKLMKDNSRCRKIKCDKCNCIQRARNMTLFKGKILCFRCKLKTKLSKNLIRLNQVRFNGHKGMSLDHCLKKVYRVKTYNYNKNSRMYCTCNLPTILSGKYFKIVLVDNPTTKSAVKRQT
jgi:hypothetical protein